MVCSSMDAVRRQQAIDGPEVVVVMVEADRLEHLDADDLVELPGQLAVVGAQHVDAGPGLAQPRRASRGRGGTARR